MKLVECYSDISFSSGEWKPSGESWATFNDFRRQGIFCDVVLQVEGVRFPVHRLVLCAFSDYFRSLFLGGWKSSDNQEVQIPGITPEVMASLLEFAYTGQIIITAHNVQDLLPAADQFQVLYVKEKCCTYLKRQLSIRNCIGICKYAEWFYCEKLKNAATEFILGNFEFLAKDSQEFLHFSFEDVAGLIADDRLNVRAEEIACEAIFRWIRANKENRIEHLHQLLSNTRLGLLEPEYFMSKVKANDLVLERMTDCRTLLNHAMRLVCDLYSPESDKAGFLTIQSRLTRPRLPREILLAVGGWSSGCSTNAIEAYDSRAETWVNISLMPGLAREPPRAYHGVAFVHRFLYIIGGFDGHNYFNTVRRFNVITNEWTQEPSMFQKRCYVSVAKMGRKIYALGGMDGEQRLNTGEVYDPEERAWSVLPDMNERRSDASATSLQNKVYISGGFNGQECLFTAEFYDPTTFSWTRITPMRSRRSGVSIVAFNGLVYAVGGFDGLNRLRTAEAYSPTTNTWNAVATMNKPRSNFGLEVVDDQLIAVGGFNGRQTSSDVEMFDVHANEWYEVREMQILRSALSCCVMDSLPLSVIRKFCVSREMNFSVGRGSSPADTAASSTTDDIQDRFARDALEFQDDSMTEDDQSDEGTFPQDPMVEE